MPSSGNARTRVQAWTIVLLSLAAAAAVSAQTSNAADLYKEALSRDAALRKELAAHPAGRPAAPILRRVRVLAGAYEDIARLFPASGHSDDALWQGAMLAADAYLQFGDAIDRATALRLLSGLRSRFPASPLAKGVPVQLARVNARAPAAQPPLPETASAVTPAAPSLQPQPPPAPLRPSMAAAAPRAQPAPEPVRAEAVTATPPVQPAAAAAEATQPVAVATPVLLREVRREVLPETLRMTLEFEREVSFRDERLDGPPRVFVDLHNTRAAEALKNATIRFPVDVVKQVRVGQQLDARTRIVFDLTAAVKYSVFALYSPFRIVIDFERPRRPASEPASNVETRGAAADTTPRVAASIPAAPAAVTAPPRPPAANRDGTFSLSRQLGLGVTRIAIDPGHGGHDPGARGNGLTEADLVLDVALRLETLLQKEAGVEVVLTRRTNDYVPLEERTAIANTSGADLFLSIHANASAAASARGIETYFLNFAPNPEAEAIAARENAGSTRSMRELPDIVQAIAMNNKLDESRDFATAVQTTLYERLRKVNRGLRNLGVKQAPFMVLIGASMPSVLAEISFMSNRQEAAMLKTEKYRQQIAEALFAGVMRYQSSLKKAPAVALKQ